jgi:hypothetical protein
MDAINILSSLASDPTLAPHHAAQVRQALEKLSSAAFVSGPVATSPDKLTMSMMSNVSGAADLGPKKWSVTTFADTLANSRWYQQNPNERESSRQEFLSFRGSAGPPTEQLELDDPDAVTSRPAFRDTHVFEDPQQNFEALNNCAMQSLVLIPNISDAALDIRQLPDFTGQPLTDPRRIFFSVAANVFAPYSLLSTLEIDMPRFYRFLLVIYENTSVTNPYHNVLHAAEVLHCVHCFLSNDEISENFSDVELLALLLCALCIDVGHFGVTNVFLTRINHPLVQIFGFGFAQEAASVSFVMHTLTQDDTNFFPNQVEMIDVLNDRLMKLHFQELFTQIFMGSAAHNHCAVLREIAEYVVNGVVRTQHIHKILIGILHLCRFPHAMQPVARNMAGVVRFLTECQRQGDEEQRRMLLVSPLCDEGAAAQMADAQRSLIADIMLPLAQRLSLLIPRAWLTNMQANLEVYSAAAGGKRPPLDFDAEEFTRWADATHPVIVSIRKIVRLAESLDRRASKAAIMNATPQRKMTQSLEVATAFSRVDHYYSFLRMFATFYQESRSFEDFAGNLVFLAHQLDPLYIGQYAVSGKTEPSVETCREVAITIVETEAAPSTSEVIASPSKRAKSSSDPFVLQLLAMYRSMGGGSPNRSEALGGVRRASWRSPPTNKLYAPEPPKEARGADPL